MKIKFNRFKQTLVFEDTHKQPFKIVKDNVMLIGTKKCKEPEAYWDDNVFTVKLPLNSSGEFFLRCSDKKGLFQTLKDAGVDVEIPETFEKFIEGDEVYALSGSFGNESGNLNAKWLHNLKVVKGTVVLYYKDNNTFYYVIIKDSNGNCIRVPYRWVEYSFYTLKSDIDRAIKGTVNELKNDIERLEGFKAHIECI